MKTSVVIPATNANFGYLNCILRHYEDGVEKPDEVVVSISNSHLIKPRYIDALENKFSRSFDMKILRHEKQMIQGPNRDAVTKAATGDIIISNDADDIPHPQRVQIIKGVFLHNDVVMLNHAYISKSQREFDPILQIKKIDCQQVFNHHFPNHIRDEKMVAASQRPDAHDLGFNAGYGGGLAWWIHAGNVAFSKEVFDVMSWRHTEEIAWDYDFCMDVLYAFNKSIIIDSPLIWYNLLKTRRDHANPADLGKLFKE